VVFEKNTVTLNTEGAGYVNANVVGDLDDGSTFIGNDVGSDVVVIGGGTLSDPQIWQTLDVTYRVDADIQVADALELTKGTTLSFIRNTGMTVTSNGSLTAQGEADTGQITLTGETQTSGGWDGLVFNQSNDTANDLYYVVIQYGGDQDSANISLEGTPASPSRLVAANCTFSESKGFGLKLTEGAVLDDFSNNTLTANQEGAAIVHPNVIDQLTDDSIYEGNDTDVILVTAGTVSTSQTWPTVGVPYIVEGDILVGNGNIQDGRVDLTIDAGVQLVFKANTGMWAKQDSQLTAVGKTDSRIVFSGEDKTAGSWKGVYFDLDAYSQNLGQNRFDYVTFEYGGGYDWATDMEGNLVFDGYATMQQNGRLLAQIDNCIFSYSETCGIFYEIVNINGQTSYANISTQLTTDGNTFSTGNQQAQCNPDNWP
jgi:hypothetical protein